MTLDIFCPVCSQFPFSHDPYTAGGNAVGKNLNLKGADGKPMVATIKQILMGSEGHVEMKQPAVPPAMAQPKIITPPCPMCGSSPNFGGIITHQVGCQVLEREKYVSSRIKAGPDRGDQPPTEAEVAEVIAEREHRRYGRNQDDLRPGEGFVEKQ